jgi:hypothetical protein
VDSNENTQSGPYLLTVGKKVLLTKKTKPGRAQRTTKFETHCNKLISKKNSRISNSS